MQSDEGRANSGAGSLARAPPGSGLPNLTFDEWVDMFAAVRVRLARTVGTLLVIAAGDNAAQARADVVECLEALGQLQALLIPERDRGLRQELEIFDLQNALALAMPELFQVPSCPRLKVSTREMNGR